MEFTIESERGTEKIEATDLWNAAGQFAADAAGFDSDDPCFDPFTFEVNGSTFGAEIEAVTGSGTGTVKVTQDETGEARTFDQDGDTLD